MGMCQRLAPSSLMVNAIQLDAVTQLLIEKGVLTEEEFFAKLKQVQGEYQKKGAGGDRVIDETVVYSSQFQIENLWF